MLNVRMTPHLLGIEITGDYDELNRLYDAIWTIVGPEYNDDPSVDMREAIMRERLLALCYDLRHAYMGTRNVRMEDNGMDREKAEWLGISLPPLRNLYYSVEVLYPEAMYEVMVLGNLLHAHRAKLIKKRSFSHFEADDPRVLFDPDSAEIIRYQSLVLEAVCSSVSANIFSRIRNQVAQGLHTTPLIYTQWIDILNCDWCGMTPEKRKKKLSTVVRDIADCWNNQEYLDMRSGIDAYIKQTGALLANVRVADVDYPDEYEW